jgi:hypothetical protein
MKATISIPDDCMEHLEEIYKGHIDLCNAYACKHPVLSKSIAIETAKQRIMIAGLALHEKIELVRQLNDREIIARA